MGDYILLLVILTVLVNAFNLLLILLNGREQKKLARLREERP